MARRPRQIYRFGQCEFTSQNAARRFFSSIRQGIQTGETVTDPAHALAVSELFRGHIEYAEKAQCGVKRFFVAPAPDHPNTTCFWIEREDGSKTDFGFNACVQTVGGLNRQSFRALIRPQIYAFKDKRLQGSGAFFFSDFSGQEFSVQEAHVDHEITFEEIVVRFANLEGCALESEMFTVAFDARSEPTWKNLGFAERFLVFHAEFPLRLVSKRENLSDLRRKGPESPRR